VDTRERILETAVQLFSTQGYTDTSLAQVARAARVSKALILWYFDSKDQLFRAALQHFLAPYEIDDQVLNGLNEQEQVGKLIDDYYDFIAEHLYSVKFVLGQVVGGDENSQELVTRARELYTLYRGLLTSILERGQTKHVFGPQVCPAADAALIMATLNGVLIQQLVEQGDSRNVRDLLTRLKHTTRAHLSYCSTPAAETDDTVPGQEVTGTAMQRTGS
jgi:AcrR family transcriptional regulator